VVGNEIIVTMPGSIFKVIYTNMGKGQLVANSFHSARTPEGRTTVAFPKFLALAWTAANDKARELGWIV
jgi:5,10-methenyltetrahydromethanopterin hydrogenase